MEDNAASSSQKKVDSFSEVLRNLVDWLITQVYASSCKPLYLFDRLPAMHFNWFGGGICYFCLSIIVTLRLLDHQQRIRMLLIMCVVNMIH